MSDTEVKKWAQTVERVTYKPGWELSVRPLAGQVNRVELVVDVAHVSDSGRRTDISVSVNFTRGMSRHADHLTDEERFQEIVALISWVEVHERDEWFRVDGKMFRNPHEHPPFKGGD